MWFSSSGGEFARCDAGAPMNRAAVNGETHPDQLTFQSQHPSLGLLQ